MEIRKIGTCLKSWLSFRNTCLLVLCACCSLVGEAFARFSHNRLHLLSWLSTRFLGFPLRQGSCASYSLLSLQSLEVFLAKSAY